MKKSKWREEHPEETIAHCKKEAGNANKEKWQAEILRSSLL